MRLPGIQQTGVQSLGREQYIKTDDAANMARVKVQEAGLGGIKAQGIAQAARIPATVAGAMQKHNEAADAMRAASEKAQAIKAVNMYKATVAEGMATTTDFDETGEPIWENQEDKLHQIKRDAQTSAIDGLPENSTMLFEEAKVNIDYEVDAGWSNKVNTAQLEDAEATALDSLKVAESTQNWGDIETIINDPHMKQVMTPKALSHYKAVATRGRMLTSYEGQRLASANDAGASLALKEKAMTDDRMSPSDKRSFIAAVNTGQINMESEGFTDLLVEVEQEKGLLEALNSAEKVIGGYLRMDADKLGGDEPYKSMLIDKLQSIRNDFASGVKRTSKAYSAANMDQMILNGRIKVSPRKGAKEYNDMAMRSVGALYDDKGKLIPGSVDEAALIDPESEQNRIMLAHTTRFGFLPQHFEKTLGTTLLNGSDEDVADVITTFAALASKDPSVLFANPESSFTKELFALVQLTGQTQEGKDEALRLYKSRAALGEKELQMYKDQTYSKPYKDAVDKGFTKVMKDKFPVMGRFFGSSAPDVKIGMRNRVKALTREYLPMAQGDPNKALNMAMETLKWEYGNTTTPNGKTEFTHHPPGQMMSAHTKLSPRQNDVWINRQMDLEIKGAMVAEGGDPNYDTSFVEYVSMPDFDPKNPTYVLVDNNPAFGGMSRQLFKYKPVFENTPEAQEQRRLEEIHRVRANRRNKNTQESMQWQKDNPSLLVVKDPALRYIMDPYEGVFSNLSVNLKQKSEDLRHKLMGPLQRDDATNAAYPSEDNL